MVAGRPLDRVRCVGEEYPVGTSRVVEASGGPDASFDPRAGDNAVPSLVRRWEVGLLLFEPFRTLEIWRVPFHGGTGRAGH